jgi:DNA modification methylase
MLSDEEVINRLITMSDCGDNYELFTDNIPNSKNTLSVSDMTLNENADAPTGTVVFGTSEHMEYIENNSVSVIVTSPPYWNLKDYFKKGQIGQEPYAVYLRRMQSVWEECYQKLNSTGSLWVNINIRIHNRKVILIPNDFIKICKDLGFYYKGIFIWHKSSGIPTGCKNIVDRHEYVLIFSKSEDFCVDKEMQKSFADYKNENISGRAFWNINRKAGSVGKKYIHPAIYPNDLVKRIVLLTTNENDLVVDPFLGSGTSLIASLQCNRNFIGYEYNEGFMELMESRFSKELDKDKEISFVNV